MNNKDSQQLPPFYIGQRVVLLQDGISYPIKKGDEFTVLDITQSPCGCWSVHIGLPPAKPSPNFYCSLHDSRAIPNYGKGWIGARYFAPIESQFHSITFKEVIEIESPITCMQ